MAATSLSQAGSSGGKEFGEALTAHRIAVLSFDPVRTSLPLMATRRATSPSLVSTMSLVVS